MQQTLAHRELDLSRKFWWSLSPIGSGQLPPQMVPCAQIWAVEGYGYRVGPHGLAGDIHRERPELAGLGNDFRILDEENANEILEELSFEQLRNREEFFRQLMKSDLADKKASEMLRDAKNGMPALLKDLA